MKKRKALVVISILLLIAFIGSGCGIIQKNPDADKNTTVASVYGENIKKSEFTAMFDIFKFQYEQQYGADVWDKEVEGKKFIDVAKEKVLDMLIENKVQMKNAADLGINVSDADVNAEIDKARKNFKTEDEFKAFLTEQKMNYDYFKENVKSNLIQNKLFEKMTADVTVNDADVNKYYNDNINQYYSVKASHILLKTEEEAKSVLVKAKSGEDFSKLAEQYSTDPTAKTNKGDLGYFRRGDMVPEFETAAFKMKAGEISEPVKTNYGYHIIKVEDVKLDKFEDVKDQIKSELTSKKKNEAYQKAMDEMKKKANIKKFIKEL